jgi:hydroxyacylglutathione hydrolase
MLLSTHRAPPFYKNGYLLGCEATREAIVIDPGDEIEEVIGAAEASALRVTQILLTHAHLDHITGVGRAKAALGAEAWLHEADLPLYRAVVQQGLMFGLQVDAQPPVDRFYAPDQALVFGDLQVKVHHTPGHSPGGVCLEITAGQDAPELFAGDTLFAGSIGRTDLPGGNHALLIASIRAVLFAFDDATPVHPGHGPSTTVGAERRSNPFLV